MDTTPDGPLVMEKGEELKPQTTDRSEPRLVSFQCTAEGYRQIVEAAEDDQRTVSSWIRKTLMEAVRNPVKVESE
jgi:hypothetical protein